MTFLWGRSLLPPSSPQTIFISIFPSYLWIIKNWAVFFKKQVQQGRSSHLCSVTCIYLNYPEQWLKSSDVTPETLVPYFHNWIFSWKVLPSFLEIREHFHSRESQNIWKRYYHPIFLFFFFDCKYADLVYQCTGYFLYRTEFAVSITFVFDPFPFLPPPQQKHMSNK